MIYTVKLNGTDMYSLDVKEKLLINPKVSEQINVSASFDFTLPPMHQQYNSIKPLKGTINVYEDGDLIFTGRPVDYKTDFWKNKTWHCEGPLAYLNDSIQEPWESDDTDTTEFLTHLINCHNRQVADDRKLTVGRVTVNVGKKLYRKLNYESTWNCVNNMLLNAEGGYIFIRHENGVNHIDYLAEMPYQTNQPIKFGMNLLDFSTNFSADDIVTVLYPFGRKDTSKSEAKDGGWDEDDWEDPEGPWDDYPDEDDEEEEEEDKVIDISSVNGGKKYLVHQELFNEYGWIAATQTWSDLHTPEVVKEKGEEWLADKQYDRMIIEAKASELHQLNENYQQFKVGQSVHIISEPHGLDKYFPLTKIEIELDSAEKTITLGTDKHRTLTEIVNPNAKEEEDDEEWEDFEVGPFELYWVKYPKTVYNFGDKFDYSEAVVFLRDQNGNSWDVTDLCTFQPMDGLAITDINVAPKINMLTANYAYNKRTGENVPLKLHGDGSTLIPAFYNQPAIKLDGDGNIVDYDTGEPIYSTIEGYDKRRPSFSPVDPTNTSDTNMMDDVIVLTVSCNCTIQMLVPQLPTNPLDEAVYYISSDVTPTANDGTGLVTGGGTP